MRKIYCDSQHWRFPSVGTWPVGSIAKKCIIVGARGKGGTLHNTEKCRKGRGVPGCHCSLQELIFWLTLSFFLTLVGGLPTLMWRSVDISRESVLSFCHVDPRDQIQVFSPGSKRSYPLSQHRASAQLLTTPALFMSTWACQFGETYKHLSLSFKKAWESKGFVLPRS